MTAEHNLSVTMTRMTPETWQRACRTLARRDRKMAGLIANFDGRLHSNSSAFETLCHAVVGQQISVRAADSIRQRLENKLTAITPQQVMARRRDVLRRCGLSARKVEYLKNIAAFFQQEVSTDDYWRQSPEAIRERLLTIKGVGHWTYEMFAIFFLRLPDIFPVNDLGLINAISRLYNDGETVTPAAALELGETWAPWRTVATWYLWRSIDSEPVAY